MAPEQARQLSYETIRVGDHVCFETTLTEEKVRRFAELVEDFNPLHVSQEFASATKFKKPIVHGMLMNSLFSRLIGMCLPGRDALYLSQNSQFIHPVFPGEKVTVRGTVVQKADALRLVTLSTEVLNEKNVVVVKGEAKALFTA